MNEVVDGLCLGGVMHPGSLFLDYAALDREHLVSACYPTGLTSWSGSSPIAELLLLASGSPLWG